MQTDRPGASTSVNTVEILIDGLPIELPANRRSLSAVCAYLDLLALDRQRILCSLNVDGQPVNLALPLPQMKTFFRVEAETMRLEETPLQILRTALAQTTLASEQAESALTQVLINEAGAAREIWWRLTRELKGPLVTLSLLPDDLCGPAIGRASFTQLRKWQLEQLAAIIRAVDAAGRSNDPIRLSDALETRVLPWLRGLQDLIGLWLETAEAGSRLGRFRTG